MALSIRCALISQMLECVYVEGVHLRTDRNDISLKPRAILWHLC